LEEEYFARIEFERKRKIEEEKRERFAEEETYSPTLTTISKECSIPADSPDVRIMPLPVPLQHCPPQGDVCPRRYLQPLLTK
jgi:hypothetical protein